MSNATQEFPFSWTYGVETVTLRLSGNLATVRPTKLSIFACLFSIPSMRALLRGCGEDLTWYTGRFGQYELCGEHIRLQKEIITGYFSTGGLVFRLWCDEPLGCYFAPVKRLLAGRPVILSWYLTKWNNKSRYQSSVAWCSHPRLFSRLFLQYCWKSFSAGAIFLSKTLIIS